MGLRCRTSAAVCRERSAKSSILTSDTSEPLRLQILRSVEISFSGNRNRTQLKFQQQAKIRFPYPMPSESETHTRDSTTSAWQEISPVHTIDGELRNLLLMHLNRVNRAGNEGRRGKSAIESTSHGIGPSSPPPQRYARRVRSSAVLPAGPMKAAKMLPPSCDGGIAKGSLQPLPQGPTFDCERTPLVDEIGHIFHAINRHE